MRRILASLAALSLAVAGLGTVTTAPAGAAAGPIDVVLLGDSYAAGNGLRRPLDHRDSANLSGPAACHRHALNWGHQVADRIGRESGRAVTFVDAACSGADLDATVAQAREAVTPDTDVVLVSAGGNDAHFAEVVRWCFTPQFVDDGACRYWVDRAEQSLPTIRAATAELIHEIYARIGDRSAQVILVGYPHITLHKPFFRVGSYAPTGRIREVAAQAARVQREVVDGLRAQTDPYQVRYVPMIEPFAGHEPDPRFGVRNPRRWLNEFAETGGDSFFGLTFSQSTAEVAHYYHPNRAGHRAYAAAIDAAQIARLEGARR